MKKDGKKVNYNKTVEMINNFDWKEWVKTNENRDIDSIFSSFNKVITSCLIMEDKKTTVYQFSLHTPNITNFTKSHFLPKP